MVEHLDTIIGGMISLLGVIVGFSLHFLMTHLSERKRVKEEFSKIKSSIYSSATVDKLSTELWKMQYFFIHHQDSLKKKENSDFFQKWLMDSLKIPLSEDASRRSGYWNPERIDELLDDLEKTKL